MNKDAVTGGLFNGVVTQIDGSPTFSEWFDYGLTNAYGSTTIPVTVYLTGAYSASIPNNLTPGATYHFRSSANNTVSWVNGTDQTFTFTLPTVTTGAASNLANHGVTLNGGISDMG